MPCITKSGLVHVHALVSKEEYKAARADAKARRPRKSVSFVLREALALRYGLPAPTSTGKYQEDNN